MKRWNAEHSCSTLVDCRRAPTGPHSKPWFIRKFWDWAGRDSWAPDTTDRALTPLTKRRQWSQRRVSCLRGHSPAQRGVEITARFGLGTRGDANHAKLWANPTEGIQAAIRPFTNQSCLTRPERVSRMAARLDSLSIRAIRVPTALGHLGRRVPPTDGDRNAIPKLPEEPRVGMGAA